MYVANDAAEHLIRSWNHHRIPGPQGCVPMENMAQTSCAVQLPAELIPTVNEAVRMCEERGGSLACDATFGTNPLCNLSICWTSAAPTRITADSKSLIDLVITSQPSKIQTSGSIDLGISDHHLIFAVFKVARSNPKPKVISTRNYKLLDTKIDRSDFHQAPWHITGLFDDIDDSVDAWQYLYNEILHHHLPRRDVRIRDNSLPWINTSIRKEMNMRYKLLQRAKS
ncbi:uncharacterized protein LOC110055830 [Orbicella faveolata]|uniref:uncharacterized protein LOC110055830 n=1 Tax=Orbicella faveolata TaxID=48498 RepID=UPI0009E3193D|nr:uncharacterized protein LOC110055830 [Orbicella faveolata]